MFDYFTTNAIFEDLELLPKELHEKLTPKEIEKVEQEKIKELQKKIDQIKD